MRLRATGDRLDVPSASAEAAAGEQWLRRDEAELGVAASSDGVRAFVERSVRWMTALATPAVFEGDADGLQGGGARPAWRRCSRGGS